MNDSVTVSCPAKINLSLDVIKKRTDGYHELKMIMQTVDISDFVSVKLTADNKISVFSDSKKIPLDENNTAKKAAKVFFEKLNKSGGAEIMIKKNIPVGAGMAGGSADAAGTLKALNILTGRPFSDSKLETFAKEVGADVPFCVRGGAQFCEGIGEILTPLPEMKNVYVTIAKPKFSVSTPWVYNNLVLDEKSVHPDNSELKNALESGEYEKFALFSGNTLEAVTSSNHSEIEEYKKVMLECGAFFSMMTGSGPAVFGIFRGEEEAKKAAKVLKEKTDEVFTVKM